MYRTKKTLPCTTLCAINVSVLSICEHGMHFSFYFFSNKQCAKMHLSDIMYCKETAEMKQKTSVEWVFLHKPSVTRAHTAKGARPYAAQTSSECGLNDSIVLYHQCISVVFPCNRSCPFLITFPKLCYKPSA